MSIKLMSAIWHNGPSSQTERFVMLALADYANDDGVCWPSVTAIAEKTCITERSVRRIMRRLCECGWLEIEPGAGRNNCNIYRVKTLTQCQPDTKSALTQCPKNPDTVSVNPDTVSAKPSRTIKKPSKGKPEKPDEAVQAFEAWNEIANRHGLPTASKLTDQRKAALQRRVKDAGGIEAFTGLIRVIPQSPFLMGNNPRGWKASLDFIAQPSSFEKLRDGIYHGGKPLEPKPEPTPDEIEQRRAQAERLKQWEDWSNA